MIILWRRLGVFTAALLLTGCGGGGSSQSPLAFGTSVPQSAGPLSLSIFIPSSTTSSSSTRRSPKFISPSTNGLVITDCVHGASPCTAFTGNVDLSSSSSACTTVNNGRSCTLTILASQGSDDFTFTTYDVTPPTTGFGTAAHQLGTSTISGLTIASGTNTVNVALGGTVASVRLNLTQRSVYGYSALTTSVGVTALDADNNIIVAGATTVSNTGAGSQTDTYSNPIAVAVSESGGSGHTKLSLNGGSATTSVTTTKSSDAIALAYDGNAGSSSYYATVTASTTNASGSMVSASANLNTISISAAGAGIGSFAGGASPKAVFASGTGESETIMVTETNGVGSFAPVGVSNLGSTNCPSSSVGLSASSFGASGSNFTISAGSVNTAGTGCVVTFTDSFGGSVSIAETENTPQSMFVTNYNNNTIAIYNQPFTNSSSPSATIATGQFATEWMAFDTGGSFYVANCGTTCGQSGPSNVQIYSPPFTNSSTAGATIASGLNGPQGMAFDTSGNLYVANDGNMTVVIYNPPLNNSSTPSVSISNGVSNPTGVAFDSGGNLYVESSNGNSLQIYHPPFSAASSPTVSITNGINYPDGLAFDSAGNLYVVNFGNNNVSIYNPPFSNTSSPSASISNGVSNPQGVAFDSIGNLYVANRSGTVTIYSPPFSNTSSPSVTVSSGLNNPQGVAVH
jgi:hypothetical protein